MIKTEAHHIQNRIIPTLIELMSKGCSFTEVAATLNISKGKLTKWLSDPTNPELQEAVELGNTLYEAYFEKIGKSGMLGEIHGFKDTVWNKFMQNKFKWSDKSEVNEIKPLQNLSDTDLDEKIKLIVNKINTTDEQRA